MTGKQISILRRTLGMDSNRPGFRNYFVTEAESEDGKQIGGLITLGLMQKGHMDGTMTFYHATGMTKKLFGLKDTER